MVDRLGRARHFTVARNVSDASAVDAIARVERQRNEFMRYANDFATCGVLTGNAGSGAAIAARAACVLILDLLLRAGVNGFDD